MSRTATKSSQSIATGTARQRRERTPLARPLLAGIVMAIAVVVGLAGVGALPRATEASRAEPPPDGISAQVKATTFVQPSATATGTKAVATPAMVGARAVASPTPTTWGYRGTTNQSVPVQVSPPVPGLTWKSVSVGFEHTCAIASDDRAYCWGRNDQGQLGDGTTVDRVLPAPVEGGITWRQVSASYQYTCGVTSINATLCWGSFGAIFGNSGAISAQTKPNLITSLDTYTQIATSRNLICTIILAQGIRCWGWSSPFMRYETPLSEFNSVNYNDIVLSGNFTEVSVGGSQVCAARDTGQYECSNRSQIRLNGKWKQVKIADVYFGTDEAQRRAELQFQCGINVVNQIGCIGNNTSGQLGLGYITPRSIFASNRMEWQDRIFNGPLQNWVMSNDQGSFITGVNISSSVNNVAVGVEHACAVDVVGSVWCWGANYAGQLGNGQLADAQPVPSKVLLDRPVSTLSAGYSNTCALAIDGSLWCWGASSSKQNAVVNSIQLDDFSPNILSIIAFGSGGPNCAIDVVRSLYCWGGSDLFYPGSTPYPFVPFKISIPDPTLSVGGNVNGACALTTNQTLWCWGRDNYSNTKYDPQQALNVQGIKIIAISSYNYYRHCFIDNNGRVGCFFSYAKPDA